MKVVAPAAGLLPRLTLRLAASAAGLALFLASPLLAEDATFVEAEGTVGLRFTHVNGMTGEFYFPEIFGGGVALFDYDKDGDLDVYLVQGQRLGPGAVADPVLTDRLFRNDLEVLPDGRRTLRFTDVTEEAGIRVTGYGMGVATGDFNGDGWTDLYIASFGSNNLLRNNGDGTFTDVTEQAGVDDSRWSVVPVFLDFDGDGHLDLYVGNYVSFAYLRHRVCATVSGAPDYCGPLAYPAETDRLFRNRGDGTFQDVSLPSGVGAQPGATLGAIAADFDGDGRLDLYVANDMMPNFLWIHGAGGGFRDEALLAGCAVDRAGQPQASMGVGVADVSRNGHEDIFLTHLTHETNTLYLNQGGGIFEDATLSSGLGPPSWEMTGFGTAFLDYDNDGLLDLLVVNGAIRMIEAQAGEPLPLRQKNQLFRQEAPLQFREVSEEAGPAFARSEVSRGAAFGDLDNDGDVDVVVTNNNGPARVLLNQVGQDAPWLGLELVRSDGRTVALGARVGIHREGAPTLWRRVATDGSYISANDPRVLVGLRDGDHVTSLEVRWPGGRVEVFPTPPLARYSIVREGTGLEAP